MRPYWLRYSANVWANSGMGGNLYEPEVRRTPIGADYAKRPSAKQRGVAEDQIPRLKETKTQG